MTGRAAPLAPAALAAVGTCGLILAMALGPLAGPAELDLTRHTTSQQAGQGMPGAWIMRAGFATYGLGTALAALIGTAPSLTERLGLVLFGLGLIGAAVWSNAPPLPGLATDLAEDARHSFAANLVGLGFAGACAARLFAPPAALNDALAWAGLVIAVAVPVAMLALPEVQGLLQRMMFLFSTAYVLRVMTRRAGSQNGGQNRGQNGGAGP